MSDHNKLDAPNLWLPEPDVTSLQLLGKLAEEAAELASRASRCIIQGLDALDPDDGRRNYEHLRDELADVNALSNLAIRQFGLSQELLDERSFKKEAHKAEWLNMVGEHVRKENA